MAVQFETRDLKLKRNEVDNGKQFRGKVLYKLRLKLAQINGPFRDDAMGTLEDMFGSFMKETSTSPLFSDLVESKCQEIYDKKKKEIEKYFALKRVIQS